MSLGRPKRAGRASSLFFGVGANSALVSFCGPAACPPPRPRRGPEPSTGFSHRYLNTNGPVSSTEAAEFPSETNYGVLTRVDGAAHMRRGADVRQISGVTPCSRITLVFRSQTFVSPTPRILGGTVAEEPRRRQSYARVFSCSWPILPSGFGAGGWKR